MRILSTMLYSILCCFFSFQSSAANFYRIQIGAFTKKMPFTHFAFSGISDIYLNTDKNNIHRYYLRTTFEELPKANRVKDSLVVRGFSNAIVIPLGIEDLSELSSDSSPTLKEKKPLSKVIHYKSEQYQLNAIVKKELSVFIKNLKKNPDLKVAIIGHTDAKGNASYNIELSKNRVRTVRRYLINQGITKEQIIAKACGEANPVLSNISEKGIDLPENRKHNRRVILILLNKNNEVPFNNSNSQTVHPILERESLKD